ncbi:hypothetical protein PSJM300_00025 [Stutzerimonas stutzeri DSM 10701]|nr:hypothetical protein PSJM300_00025 [Stutzerimonas stutzeri DSM 10701]
MSMVADVRPFHLVIASHSFLMHGKVEISFGTQFNNNIGYTWLLDVLENIPTALSPSGVAANQLFDGLCMISGPCIYLCFSQASLWTLNTL